MPRWTEDSPAKDAGIEVPEWIDQDILLGQIEDIFLGGCDSGAYMPAVTYHEALKTMHEHGSKVFDFLEEHDFNTTALIYSATASWPAWACKLVSAAVEHWAFTVRDEAEKLTQTEDED
jgi:hypothetical protein